MAIGIFILAALQQLPFAVGSATRVLALGLLILWLAIAGSLAWSTLRRGVLIYTGDPTGAFGIGTWIAGTAVLAEVLHLAFPGWRLLVILLSLLAALLWLWFLYVAAGAYRTLIQAPAQKPLGGRILLLTVSTQSLVIAWHSLEPGMVSAGAAEACVVLGILFYVAGLGLIGWRYRSATNCILHGAMSITGLAAVVSHALGPGAILAIWLWVACMFLGVESLELTRLVLRVHWYGWSRGAFSYDVSQWARNFTFGMFYAFTLAWHEAGLGMHTPLAVHTVVDARVRDGQYVVLTLLVIEILLFVGRARPLVEWHTGDHAHL
jgi:hypothetical protein